MYDEILVPTDGSPAATAALDHALTLASTFGARLHALYVVDGAVYTSLDAGSEAVIDALQSEGEQSVTEIDEKAAEAGIETISEVATGSPYKQILAYAEDNDIDLIVMGTHGRTGLDRYLLGSVTERVVRSSDVPVLTVRHRDA
ncbi:universal stress protein [Haloferacaceae archaeon DSL9]